MVTIFFFLGGGGGGGGRLGGPHNLFKWGHHYFLLEFKHKAEDHLRHACVLSSLKI